ncbi:MAG: hypothetical protein R3E68_22760 [Burkholderiaceae bacterium]
MSSMPAYLVLGIDPLHDLEDPRTIMVPGRTRAHEQQQSVGLSIAFARQMASICCSPPDNVPAFAVAPLPAGESAQDIWSTSRCTWALSLRV